MLRPLPMATALALLALSACRDDTLPSWANPEPAGDAGADGDTPGPAEFEFSEVDGGSDAGPSASYALPPANAGFDYQLGGAYPLPDGVTVVSRDRQDAPAKGAYNICYVNGFQVQPDEESFWLSGHPDLVLRDGAGDPVIDPDWDEMLLDVGTRAKREALADIVGAWIRKCADDGFDAVEIDNLDTYGRSGGQLKKSDAVAFIAMLTERAHAAGLAIAQKNAAELVDQKDAMGTDFVVTEECNRYDECDVYTAAYGNHVLVIEYRRADFEAGCDDFPQLSIVLRDLDVSPAGESGHVYDGC